MQPEERLKICEQAKQALFALHQIWIEAVRISPDDSAMQSAAKEAYDKVGALLDKLISEPSQREIGERRCAWCNSRTEVPF